LSSDARRLTVSVCVPARDEAATIGPIVESLMHLRERGTIDQVLVVDASRDGTGEIAARLGAEVHRQESLRPEFGPVLGKGDAMWRALSVLSGEIVCFVDADSEHFGPHFVTRLVAPLLEDPAISFVKGFYRRPFKVGDVVEPEGGGRVTELTARPLLQLFYPELAGIRQPLAGEVAARRDLLERLPFATGYAVEIAMLIDAFGLVGAGAIAQVDLDVRQNRHQPLSALGPMAADVLRAVAERLEREGRLSGGLGGDRSGAGGDRSGAIVERPPMASVRQAA
jgi:glucosyl-3-phosphoglycerate synthase